MPSMRAKEIFKARRPSTAMCETSFKTPFFTELWKSRLERTITNHRFPIFVITP